MEEKKDRNESRVGNETYVHGYRDVSMNPTKGVSSHREKMKVLKKKLK